MKRLTITTSSNVLKFVRLPILLLDDFSQIFSAIMDFTSLINAPSTTDAIPTLSTGEGPYLPILPRLPITAKS